MLELGVLAPVASATAACMILYTSASATAAFYVFGCVGDCWLVCMGLSGLSGFGVWEVGFGLNGYVCGVNLGLALALGTGGCYILRCLQMLR